MKSSAFYHDAAVVTGKACCRVAEGVQFCIALVPAFDGGDVLDAAAVAVLDRDGLVRRRAALRICLASTADSAVLSGSAYWQRAWPASATRNHRLHDFAVLEGHRIPCRGPARCPGRTGCRYAARRRPRRDVPACSSHGAFATVRPPINRSWAWHERSEAARSPFPWSGWAASCPPALRSHTMSMGSPS